MSVPPPTLNMMVCASNSKESQPYENKSYSLEEFIEYLEEIKSGKRGTFLKVVRLSEPEAQS